MNQSDKDTERLRILKEKLSKGEMSVLVGAGFSKNVDAKMFLSWSELIYDMGKFILGSELKESYRDYAERGLESDEPQLKQEEFFKYRIEEYANKVGYLELVSEYIRRKGHREAVTTYIEERTPRIVKHNDKPYLEMGGMKKELTESMLTQHRWLLNLPWNNVYTTNYDELLEQALDPVPLEAIENEMKEIKKEIKKLRDEKVISSKKLSKNDNELSDITKKLSVDKVESKKQDDLKSERAKLKLELDSVEQRLTESENLLKKLERAKINSYTIVTKSAQLSLKRNKNIIKLHGTLRQQDSLDFGFDGDIRKQYVISKEDYETYPKRHEAFTQLMRISLLQESYCLIGFSGTDPNFREWVKWVRKIIDRHKNRDEENTDYKIYLIDINDNKLDADMDLFYENHRIYRVPLLKDSVLDFLKDEIHEAPIDRKDRKSAIELLLKFLADTPVDTVKIDYEAYLQGRYQNAWKKVAVQLSNNTGSTEGIGERLIEIRELREKLTLTDFSYSYQEFFLLHSPKLNMVNDRQREDLFELYNIAINDARLIPMFSSEQYVQELDKPNKHLRDENKALLLLRENVFLNNDAKFKHILQSIGNKANCKNAIYFEKILFSMYSLDFDQTRQLLNDWQPSPRWYVRKNGLLAMFDSASAIKSLREFYNYTIKKPSQTQLNVLALIRYIEMSQSFSLRNRLIEQIEKYRAYGLKTIDERLIQLFMNIEATDKKIRPRGADRFVVSQTIDIGKGFEKIHRAFQLLQTLVEVGYPISLPNVYLVEKSDWYNVHQLLFETLPYPTLFYSLQSSNSGILKRIGQDYAYSEGIKGQLSTILIKLLRAFLMKSTPEYIKKNILLLSAQLFVAVDPAQWEKLFRDIITSKDFIGQALKVKRPERYDFVKKGYRYVKTATTINWLLEVALEDPKRPTADLLRILAGNCNIRKIKPSKSLRVRIDKLIEELPDKPEYLAYIHNINMFINDKHKQHLNKTIPKIALEKIRSPFIWGLVIIYAQKNKKLIENCKQIILSNKLWDSGIVERGTYNEITFASSLYSNNLKIKWEPSDLEKIYSALKTEMDTINKHLDNTTADLRGILKEMYYFLIEYQKQLKNFDGFEATLANVQKAYFSVRGYLNLVDGLLSDDKGTVLYALADLRNSLSGNTIEKVGENELTILLNKVLFLKTPRLEESVMYLASVVGHKKTRHRFKKYSHTLLQILRTYINDDFFDLDKAYIYKYMISIAETLAIWQIDDDIIDKWLQIKTNTRFNNIREDCVD